MKVIWAILCERVTIDRDTNNLSLINVIEEVTVPAQPPQDLSEAIAQGVIPANFELVTLWSRSNPESPERWIGRVRIAVPDAPDTITQEHEIDLTQFLRLRSRLKLPGIPAGGQGVYLFSIEGKPIDGEWSGMFDLPIRVVLPAQESA